MRDWNKAAGLACMGEGRIIIMKQPEIMLLAKINWWMRLYFRLALCFMSDRSVIRHLHIFSVYQKGNSIYSPRGNPLERGERENEGER